MSDRSESVAVQFGTVDYVVFTGVLIVSLGIGFLHCLRGNKTPEEYLLGGRSMSSIPVAVSLTASIISAVGILGNTGEVYAHGTQMSMVLIGSFIGILIAANLFVPVFFPLKLTSVNEYIELRFKSRGLRLTVMLLSTVMWMIYLGLCLYAPTLALASVTPLSINIYIIVLGVICTLYSTIGGLKAVVWTDVFQMTVVMVGVFVVIVLICIEFGGIQPIWSIAQQNERIQFFDLGMSLYQRHSLANVITMGVFFYMNLYGVSQMSFQRICSVPSINTAKRVLYLSIAGLAICYVLLYFCGLCAFATYVGCDPLKLGLIDSKDQILPYFVMDRMGFIYGMPGLIVATLFSGALSSLSSVINSVAAVLWTDILEPLYCFRNVTKTGAATISKALSCLTGVAMIGMSFFAKRFGGLIQAAFIISGVMGGPIVGIFLLGVLVPRCDYKGATVGLLISAVVVSWISMGALLHGSPPELLPFSTDNCSTNSNLTSDEHPFGNLIYNTIHNPDSRGNWTEQMNSNAAAHIMESLVSDHNITDSQISPLMAVYGISYTLYTFLGVTICFLVGLLITFITGNNSAESVPPELVAPVVRRFTKSKCLTPCRSSCYKPE